MLKDLTQNSNANRMEDSFDQLMANLLVLITHHSLTQCQGSLSPIVERLKTLCNHSELEHYPQQLRVLSKMLQLWETKLFNIECGQFRH